MSDSADSVKVAVRVRPQNGQEVAKGCRMVIEKEPTLPQLSVSGGRSYTFNHVFMPEDDQKFVYNEAIRDIIDKLFEGYNVTILAYGQTSSGKTYTMGTTYDGEDDETCGIIPRAMTDIFSRIDELKGQGYTFTVSCTFLELYQEDLYDLLSEKPREGNTLDIREVNSNIVIPGVTEISVQTARETTNCLMRGSAGRAVGATAMNATSSRSHAIFSLKIEFVHNKETMTAKFHLVDLAGSERASKTKATGERFKEGVKINQGLLCLGNVISALGSGSTQGNYVCYRDSKLTRLLQGSLGGNSVTLMIACVSPADYNLDETVSTLRYANRAKKIKNKPVVNRDPNVAEIMELKQIIQQLRMDLLKQRTTEPRVLIPELASEDNSKLRMDLFLANERNIKMHRDFQATLNDLADFQMKCVTMETINEELVKLVDELMTATTSYSDTFPDEGVSEGKQEDQMVAFEVIKTTVGKISQLMMRQKEEVERVNESSKSFCLDINGKDSLDIPEMQQKLEACTSKQVNFSNELRNLNHQLAQKEELHKKCVENLMREEVDEKVREYESVITQLENERADLMEKLQSVKKTTASAKLAEERRKRLQQLEQEITDMKKKITQQAKLLKVRERDSQKVATLTMEIQQMRQTKVKLIRAMRTENENYRNWKIAREKEMCQLKEKDRKRENEMKRMAAMHNKQSNVLKRKFEEAVAKSKRLEVILDRQKHVQAMRKGYNNSKIGSENITTWLDHEIEVLLSTIDAKVFLDHLMEDRGMVTMRLNETRAMSDPNPDELAELEEDLEMRNAQITDLQQKTMNFSVTTKAKSISDGIVSLQDARHGIKHIFNILADIRREMAQKESACENYKSEAEELKEKIEKLEATMMAKDMKHALELHEADKNCQEKITIILRNIQGVGLNTSGKVKEIDGVLLDNIDELREQNENLKAKQAELLAEIAKLKNGRQKRGHSSKTANPNVTVDIFSDSRSDESADEDHQDDPDWRMTPMWKRKGKSSISETAVSEESSNSKKRKIESTSCNCKTNCAKNTCGCRRHISFCSAACGCPSSCLNQEVNADAEVSSTNEFVSIEDDKENTPTTPQKVLNIDQPEHLTPYPYKNKKPTFFE
ncbi:Kinesin-like protein [Sergentomyia squamirostris]